MRPMTAFFLAIFTAMVSAQERAIQRSEHGWYLSPHGTIRILVLFAEIEYDKNPGQDPQPQGAEHWPKGQLPRWRDELFDPHPNKIPKAQISRYYHDISLGRYTVLGDYLDRLLVIRESEHAGIGYIHGLGALAVSEANKLGTLRTRHGLGVKDFDLWKRGGRPGAPKEMGADDPHSYDHVMVILRNSALEHGRGSTDNGSPGALYGYESDSQSRFGAMFGLPFEILKHEFNHLLIGGNNFHSGGGNAAQFMSYFPCVQGGWSMMGGASSSLLTCTGWDRVRMGWHPPDVQHTIRARDKGGREVNGDLDPLSGDTGLYVLRDFVTSGDAIRIRMPFLPEGVYPQWLWIENHQGHLRNGSPTDKYHWEGEQTCVSPFQPGLYLQMQVDREEREGINIFGGYADYLRPVPANGFHDFRLRGDTVHGGCPFGKSYEPHLIDRRTNNPLSGNHEQELVLFDKNSDGVQDRAEHWQPGIRQENGRVTGVAVFFGHPDHAFHMNGNRRLAMGTDPSSAPMLTLTVSGRREARQRGAPDLRFIPLNGISITLEAMNAAGDATVRIRVNDTYIDHDVRWCADSIVLPPLRGRDGHSLVMAPGRTLLLDRGEAATRLSDPDRSGRVPLFTSPTRFTVSPGASISIAPKATLHLRRGSELHLLDGSSLDMGPGARLLIDGGSRLVVHGGARLSGHSKALRTMERKGRIVRQ